jgi:hypothetical protein
MHPTPTVSPTWNFPDLRAHGAHGPHDLVAWNARVAGGAPLVAHGVQVGVADAAGGDVDLHVVGSRGRSPAWAPKALVSMGDTSLI